MTQLPVSPHSQGQSTTKSEDSASMEHNAAIACKGQIPAKRTSHGMQNDNAKTGSGVSAYLAKNKYRFATIFCLSKACTNTHDCTNFMSLRKGITFKTPSVGCSRSCTCTVQYKLINISKSNLKHFKNKFKAFQNIKWIANTKPKIETAYSILTSVNSQPCEVFEFVGGLANWAHATVSNDRP